MKLAAAKWTVTSKGIVNVTEIRANELWHNPGPGGEEAKRDKFDRLFSELREEAAANLPEGTRVARFSTLPLIDARYGAARIALVDLWKSWPVATDEELIETRAYHAITGTLFKYCGDADDAKEGYLQVLDEAILGYYHDTRDAYETAVAAGGYVSEGWQLGRQEVERAIEARGTQLLNRARMWVKPALAENMIRRPQADYKKNMRARIGTTIESGEAWITLEESFFRAALDVVGELGAQVYEGSAGDAVPPILESARKVLDAREVVIKEGQYLPLLSMPCNEVREILDSLDGVLLQIRDGSDAAKLYGRVYAAFFSYWQLRCATIISNVKPTTSKNDDESMTFERLAPLTSARIGGIKAVLKNYWESVAPWAWIEEEAAKSGRSIELNTAKETAYAELEAEIVKIEEDPWKGPLGRDPRGRVVPYAGIAIGEELYKDWIVTLAYEAYREIRNTFTGGQATATPEDYVATESYVTAILKEYKNLWDYDPVHGVMGQPGFVKSSVKDEHWAIFEVYVRGKVGGAPYTLGIQAFKDDVDTAYVRTVINVRNEIDKLRLNKGTEFPARIIAIEDLVKALPSSYHTVTDARNLLAELKLLHNAVPWNPVMQERYDDIHKALKEFIEPKGGVLKVGYRLETREYFVDEEDKFKESTNRDKLMAEWVGLDYESALLTWQNTVWDDLRELEKRTDLIQSQYFTEQELVLKRAMGTYLLWRGELIDIARPKLVALATRLRTGTASEIEKTQARTGSQLIYLLLHDEIEELGIALEQMLPGAILPAALKPFAKFKPLKSISGFDVEEFSFKHLDKFIENWAEPRIKDSIMIEPKINGYRLILEAKDGDCRIYLEEATKDYSKIYTSLAAELKALPSVILDGELTEEAKGEPIGRSKMGKYRRAAVDDSNAVVHVFDILYLDGEDLHDKPYNERRAMLDKFFAGRSFKHLRKLPSWEVHTIDELLEKAKKADAYPSSEGFMAKTLDSKYLLGRRTGEWSKAKFASDIQVMVLGITKTKAKDYVYRCGVEAKKIEGIDPNEIEEYAGKKYIVLGNTFRTSLKAKRGDHLEVSVSELVEQEGDRGKKYNWMLPKVKDKTTRAVDTLRYAQEVGQLLTASIGRPWDFITGVMDEVLTTMSVPRLRTLKAQLFDVLADLNFERVIRFASNAVSLIRERLGQAVDPLITNRGVEKVYEIETTPRVTESLIGEVNARLTALIEDIQTAPEYKKNQGLELLQILKGYKSLATGSMLSRVEELVVQVKDFVETMGESGTRSVIDVDHKLAEIERDLDDLIRKEPETLVEDAADLQGELTALINAMGKLRDYFDDRLQDLSSRFDKIELPLHNTESIRDWLGVTRMLITAGIEKIQAGDTTSRFILTATIPIQLNAYWREMTDPQRTLFADEFENLRAVLKSIKDMFKTLGGAFIWAATKPLKLDLGCGENKEPGHIGIDIKPGPGVDKVCDLSEGIPYPDSSVDEVRAHHFLEHLPEPIEIMTEVWRVLKDGGLLAFEIPSTRGEGADADPTHKSRWNRMSFAFYTDDGLRESHDIPCKFDLLTIEEEEDPETGAVYVRGVLRAQKKGKYAPVESETARFLPLKGRGGGGADKNLKGKQMASQSISAAEDTKAQEITPQALIEEAFSGYLWYAPGRITLGYGARMFLEPSEYGTLIEAEARKQDWEPAAREIIEQNLDKETSIHRLMKEVQLWVRRSSSEILEKIARDRAPKDYAWPLPLMTDEPPPGASREWFNAAKAKESLAHDPMMIEILEEFGPEGVNVFNNAIENVSSGLVTVGRCSGYYGGVTSAGIPFFVTAAHCVKTQPLTVLLPNGDSITAIPGIAHKDTQIVFAGKPQQMETIIRNNKPLSIGTELSGYAIALGTLYSEAELLRNIGDRYSEGQYGRYAGLFKGAKDLYEDLHRYRGGYSGGPIINTNGEVLGLSSAELHLSWPDYGDYPKILARYSSLNILNELYELNDILIQKRGTPPLEGAFPQSTSAAGGGTHYEDEVEVPGYGHVAIDNISATLEGEKTIPVPGYGYVRIQDIRPYAEKHYGIPRWTPKELVKFVLQFYDEETGPHFARRFSYGAHEFLTSTDLQERDQKLREWLRTTDFEPLAAQVLEGEGDWPEFREALEKEGSDFIRDFDHELEQKARERAPEGINWALGPVRYTPPEGATKIWERAAKMKDGLSKDPMMLEIEEDFGPEGSGPFYRAIDKAIPGLVQIRGCSGYYAGVDNEGIPCFISAAHCIRDEEGPHEAILPDGTRLMVTSRSILGDIVVLQPEHADAEKILGTMTALPLAKEYSGYGLMIGNSYDEAELVHRGTKGWGISRLRMHEEAERARGGYSGGPLINSHGEVMGILSQAHLRKGQGIMYPLKYLAFEPYEILRQLYQGIGIIEPQPLEGGLLSTEPIKEGEQSEWGTIWWEPEPEQIDTPEKLIELSRTKLMPWEVKEHFSFGAIEFLTGNDLAERDERIREWKATTDFKQVAQEVIDAGGSWRELRDRMYEMASEFIKEFDRELEKRARAHKPKDYPWALKSKEWIGPPGATSEWNLAMGIKNSLSRDPFMRDLEEFDRAGINPFHQAIDSVASSLITVADPKRAEGGVGPYHASCGGYCAGTDSADYPLYITATHCLTSGGNLIILANGQTILADVIERHGDSAMLRGRERIDTTKSLGLGTAEGGWALGLSPLYKEGELVRYDESITFDPEMYVSVGHPEDRVGYGRINLGRPGWSGSPVINSRGEVLGIASLGRSRGEARYDEGGPDWILGYVPLRDLQELYRKADLPWKGILGGAKLTKEGEQSGNARLDFMNAEPSKIPVTGVLWTHTKGADVEHKALKYDEMMKLDTKDDVLNLHHDLRFGWRPNALEAITIFLGNQTDKDKFLRYDGGKLGSSLKQLQPVIWNNPKELDNRVFSPGTVGNISAKETYGAMFKLADVSMIPSRVRSKPKGSRYFEWYMKVEGYPELTGLWALSEGASAAYDLPFMFWRMKNETPFYMRTDAKHKKERSELPDWQKPTEEEIEKFLGRRITKSD